MSNNKYSKLNEEQLSKYIEDKETEKALRISKKKFNKKNKKQIDTENNELLVAKLNSELTHQLKSENTFIYFDDRIIRFNDYFLQEGIDLYLGLQILSIPGCDSVPLKVQSE